jgi:uncharacterized protein
MTSVDRHGRSQLHSAAVEDDLEQARSLLDRGANPNIADRQGLTPSHLAAQAQAARVASLLLERGESPNAADRCGNTPLWTAVFNSRGAGELIALLRAYGADPYYRNQAGRTPVELARQIANYPVASFFADLPTDET